MKRQTLSGGVVPAGVDELNTVASQLNAAVRVLQQGTRSSNATPGTRVEPYGSWPVAYRPKKSGVIDDLPVSLDPAFDSIRLDIEEYIDDGVGGITVVDTKSGIISVDPNLIADVGSGVFVLTATFPHKLEVNASYGLIRAYGYDGSRKVKNPSADPPDPTSRVIGDYLITWNSTSGVVVVPQESAPTNIVKNGAFTYADDAPAPATDLRKWRTVNGTAVISTLHTGDDVYWNDVNARVAIQKANDGVTQGIGKRVRRLELENIAFSLIGSTPFTADILIDVQKSGISVLVAIPTVTADLTTTSQRYNAAMQIDSGADLSGNLDIYIYTTTSLNNDGGGATGYVIYLTDIMSCHGKTPQPYALFPGEVGRGGTDSFDRTITGTALNADVGVVGKYGYDQGFGGLISPA